MIRLIRKDAAPKILGVFQRGRLLKQQHPDAECVYRGEHNLPCAIGVLLTDEEAATLPYGESIEWSIMSGTVEADDPEWFSRVQEAHDACGAALDNLLTEQHGPSQPTGNE